MDLQVHHLNYDHVGNEDVYNDLITLCKYCHQSIEEQKKDFQNTKYKYSEEQYMLARRMELRFCEEKAALLWMRSWLEASATT